jgi:GrpB-like predicted nucleotidyltransferase (UPF0157 family)
MDTIIYLRRHVHLMDVPCKEPVILTEYDESWSGLFVEESENLKRVMGDLIVSLEHIGSTAIPGLLAKPVIDIMMSVRFQREPLVYSGRLLELGYHHMGHEDEPSRIFFWKVRPRTHHLHVVEHGGTAYLEHLTLRDTLRKDSEAMREYAKLKKCLAVQYRNDRDEYCASKQSFIRKVLDGALSETP